VTPQEFDGFAGAVGSPGRLHSDYASAESAKPLETLHPHCSSLHALNLGVAFICTDILGLKALHLASRLVARAAG
jgi:hypothetical protein